MNCKISAIPSFKKDLKRLGKRYRSLKDDYKKLLVSLHENPLQGVDLGGGLHKVRMAITSKGKGKSGGARVITLVALVSAEEGEVLLLTMYDKSERENISDRELMDLKAEAGLSEG